MKKYVSVVLLIVCASVLHAADAQELPKPPAGYTWARCPEIKGAFLKPAGWHFKKVTKKGARGFFITKEKISTTNGFATGLSINVVTDIPKKKSMTPYAFARQYRETARKTTKFSKEWDKDMGPFKSVGFMYVAKDAAGSSTIHMLLIANNKTGALYFVMFEAPTADWAEAWKIADPMLQYLLIDDTI